MRRVTKADMLAWTEANEPACCGLSWDGPWTCSFFGDDTGKNSRGCKRCHLFTEIRKAIRAYGKSK